MLVINYDIEDAYITNPAQTIIDSPLNLPKSNSGSISNAISITPDDTAVLLTPLQMQDTWPTQVKMQLSDYLADTTKWEGQQVRGPGDWFLHSLGQVSAPLTTKYSFGRNVGFFVEMWLYAKSKSSAYALFDMSFGSFFTLYVHSDGSAEIWDRRLVAVQQAMGVAPAPVAKGSISNGQEITGKFIRLAVQPTRRGQILISSSLGGFFWANVGSFVDTTSKDTDTNQPGLNVITESGAVTLYQFTQPVNALFSLSPLMYPASGSWQSGNLALRYPITVAPTNRMLADQEFGSSITMTLSKTPSTGNPVQNFSYTLAFRSGVGSAPYRGGNSAALNLGNFYTPFDYYNQIFCDRQLGTRQYGSKIIYNPTSARLTLSEERAQKAFDFTLDNPGELWTSLKDLENRKVHIYLSTPEIEGIPLGNRLNTGSAADPDEPLIANNDGQPVDVFFGYGDVVEFDDGRVSKVQTRCVGMRKKLQKMLLSDAPVDDGHPHTKVVHDILKACGYVTPEEATSNQPAEMYIYPDTTPLPSAGPGTEPLFRPQNGQTAEEYLQLIQTFSGWTLDDVGGIWYYVPAGYFIAGGIFTQGVPEITQTSQVSNGGRILRQGTDANGELANLQIPDAVYPNPPTMTMLAEPSPHQTNRGIIANDIWVVGMSDDGEPIIANYVDNGSISDRTATNYVGDRWRFILVSAAINTQAAATAVCAVLAANLTVPQRSLEFSLPDWRPELPIDTAVTLDGGYGVGLISSVDADFSCDRARKTRYVADLDPVIF